MAGVAVLNRHGDKVRLTVEPEHLDEVTAALSRSGLRSLVSNPPTLEELFLREYGDELPPPVAGDEPAPVAGTPR
jgi:ABC-2 type transport system ATP-binding protein